MAPAATFTVNSTLDEPNVNPASGTTCVSTPSGVCTLRAAIQAANNSGAGPHTVNVPPGTYTLSQSNGALLVSPGGGQTFTINGTGTAANTIIQATNTGCPSVATCNNRVFDLDHNLAGNATVTIQYVTIAHGRTSDSIGGAGIIAGCETPGCPGGFDATTVNDVVFNDNQVLGTSAGAVGGGIQNIGGTLIVQNSTFTNNSAGVFRGGGIYYDSHSPSVGTFTVSNSTFTGNTSGSTASGGGAIYMTAVAGSTLSVTGSSFTGNQATGTSAGGGAIYKDGGATLNIDHSTFVNNQVLGNDPTVNLASGGAIDTNTGSVTVSFSRFVGNTVVVAGHGGAIFNAAGATTTATNNWWGCNGGPNTAGCDTTGGTVSFNPWIVLSHTASPDTILVNQSTTLTASLLQNSAGTPLTAGNVSALIGLPITFNNAVLGNLSGAQATIQPNGTAVATFTAGNTAGTGHADATVDNGIATSNIAINDAPITGLAANNSSPTIVNNTTYFTATIAGGSNVSYAWNFGDGALGNGATTTHSYSALGFYTTRVTATNSTNTIVATTPVTITDVPITDLVASNSSPTSLGSATTFTATANGSNISYQWDMGDGFTSSGATASYIYPSVGFYTARVTATNSANTLVATTLVTITDTPISGLSASNSSPTRLGSATMFTVTASGSNITYQWNLGDGSLGSGAHFSHTYGAVGSYMAQVTATNGVSTVVGTTSATILDTLITGLAASNSSPTAVGDSTAFTATISGGSNVSYAWDLGDGSVPVFGNPVTHTYQVTGTFTAIVTATNNVSSMVATTRVTITAPVTYSIYLPLVFRSS
jgi:CSLREA domain-containing protein